MDDIFYYINILLPQYKCIALPGLGAFILNESERELCFDKTIVLGRHSVSFNSELQHDDGVISSYIQSVKGISYDNANKELTAAIKELKKQLLQKNAVDCGMLGQLTLVSGQVLFTPNTNYIFPAHYGLTAVSLNTISSIRSTSERANKKVTIRKKLIIASASAAAAILLLLPTSVITDVDVNKGYHEAGFLKSLVEDRKVVQESLSMQPMIGELDVENVTTSEPSKEVAHEAKEIVVEKKKSGRTYYIIVGGASSMNAVNKIVEQFEADGLANLQIVESTDRFRIYAKSFEDKQEAEKAVIQFRQDHPKYETAWLFSKKN